MIPVFNTQEGIKIIEKYLRSFVFTDVNNEKFDGRFLLNDKAVLKDIDGLVSKGVSADELIDCMELTLKLTHIPNHQLLWDIVDKAKQIFWSKND